MGRNLRKFFNEIKEDNGMSTKKISSVAGIDTTAAVLLILVAVLATTAATTTIASSYAQTTPSIFRATLEGEQEVPPVDSDAKGICHI